MSATERPFLNEHNLPNDDDSSFDLSRDEGDVTYATSSATFSQSSRFQQVSLPLIKLKHRIASIWIEKVVPSIGLYLIILSQFFNTVMNVTTKLLETDPDFEEPIHPLQILFVRMLITVTGCYLYLRYIRKEPEILGPRDLRWLLVLRGVVGFFGVFSMYYSLMYLSVSDAVVITFLVPSVTGFLAWAILRERWSLLEAGGGLVSLVGVLLIARPSFLFGRPENSNHAIESSDPEERLLATMVGLVGVVGASSVYIVIRKIGKRVHSLITTQYFAAWCVFISLSGIIVIPGLSFKIPHTGRQWFLFFTLGISGFLMQFLLTEGIQREKASRASAMLYTQMVYAIFWEITIWNHLPNIWSWLGIIIILGSAFAVIYYKPVDKMKLDAETPMAPLSTEDDRDDLSLHSLASR
jgi:drug/metabolite transporter (DMT)-like permease